MKIFKILLLGIMMNTILTGCKCSNDKNCEKKENTSEFECVSNKKWELIFNDKMTGNWQENWFKDGEIAKVTTSDDGLIIDTRSYDLKDNSTKYYAVLWTNESFEGNIKIEYDFTRLDANPWGVNIIYFLASGMGKSPYDEDIMKWSNLRKDPFMDLYFNYMKTYHISYAAHNLDIPDETYIRLRRYIPKGEVKDGLSNTDFEPSYFSPNDCLTGEITHIEIIKYNDKIYMQTTMNDIVNHYEWDTSTSPPLKKGRIGLRLMANRISNFKNFKIYSLSDN